MIVPKNHIKEPERLKELKSYSILDTLPESDFDDLTTIAAEICGTPISLISLLDDKRQWFKSHHGLDAIETPKEYSFCGHVINQDDLFVVSDARLDERFHDNPLVTGYPYVVFYAGVPLVGDNNLPLGTLCIIDHNPRSLDQSEIKSLKALSNQIMNLFKLRRNKQLLEKAYAELEEKNQELEQFAFIAAHDLKSPLIGILGMAKLFFEDYGSKIDAEGHKMLELILSSAERLKELIDGLLEYSRSESLLKEEKSRIDLKSLINDMIGLFTFYNELEINLNSSINEIFANKTAIDQILINLITNSIKYSDKDKVKIEIEITEDETSYMFSVQDNGPGIALNHQEKIFEIFRIIAGKDKFGKTGNGIGLATVKKIIEKLGGNIMVESELGKGAKFIFTIEK